MQCTNSRLVWFLDAALRTWVRDDVEIYHCLRRRISRYVSALWYVADLTLGTIMWLLNRGRLRSRMRTWLPLAGYDHLGPKWRTILPLHPCRTHHRYCSTCSRLSATTTEHQERFGVRIMPFPSHDHRLTFVIFLVASLTLLLHDLSSFSSIRTPINFHRGVLCPQV